MPKDYEYRIKATDDASRVVEAGGRKIAASLKNTQSEFDSTASKGKQLAQVLEAMAEDAEAEMRGLEAASERLGAALGDELAGDAREMAAQLRGAGLSFEEIEADADELAAAIRRVDDVAKQAGGGVKRSMGDAADGLDRVRDSGDQSRSVLANMAGNATSELPGIAGALGPVNVAMGQLAEYAADGNIKLRSLIGLGVGMAGLGIGIKVVTDHFAKIAASNAFSKEKVDGWVSAMREGKSLTEAMVEAYSQAGKVEVELGDDVANITGLLADLGLSAQDFADLTQMSAEQVDAWAASMRAAGVDGTALALVEAAIAAEADDVASATAGAAVNAAVFGENTRAGAADMQAAADAGNRYREALDAMNASQDAALGNNISLAEAMLNTADSLDQYAATMQNAEATDREKQQAGLDLISTMQQEAEAAGRSAYDQAVASGNAAGAQQASTRAQIEALWRLAGELAPGSYLRNQITDHINALNNIPRTINTTVRVNASYGQGTELLPLEGFRASGGPVEANSAYVVGEEGPELFVPSRSGTIIPNGAGGTPVPGEMAAAGAGVTFHIGQVNVYPQTLGGSGEDVIDSLEVAVRRGGSNRLRRLVGLT